MIVFGIAFWDLSFEYYYYYIIIYYTLQVNIHFIGLGMVMTSSKIRISTTQQMSYKLSWGVPTIAGGGGGGGGAVGHPSG